MANHGSEQTLVTTPSWVIETPTAPPGHLSNEQEAIGGTLNENGYIQPGHAARGTVCFPDVGPGPVQIVFGPPGTRAVWVTRL